MAKLYQLGHEYNIYPFPSVNVSDTPCDPHKRPELDAYQHIQSWIGFLQLQYCDGKPLPSHYPLFPAFNTHNIHWGGTLSTTTVNELLSTYAKEAGLSSEALTSHCFHRGGVQYWLIHAPVTQRWSLEMCRWWGGWAAGEEVSRIFQTLCTTDTLYSQPLSSSMPLMHCRMWKLIIVMHWHQSRLIIKHLLVVLYHVLTPCLQMSNMPSLGGWGNSSQLSDQR